MSLNTATLAANLFAASSVLLLILYASAGTDQDLGAAIWLLLFGGWAISPHLALGGASAFFLYQTNRSTPRDLVLLLGTLAVAAFGLFIYVNAFFIHLDPQSALVFLFVPLWQWLGAAATLALALVLGARVPRRDTPPPQP